MLRHVCASWLGQMQGVEALTIRDLLGHSSVTMTDRYMHGDQADLHDAVHKLGNFRAHFYLVTPVNLTNRLSQLGHSSRAQAWVPWNDYESKFS